MKKKMSKLQIAQKATEEAINKTNEKINELGECTGALYQQLTDIQNLFDRIRNIPSDKQLRYEELKEIRLNWKQQAEKIEKDYEAAKVKDIGAGAAGAGLGIAVAAMGPTAAMGVATTFGVASTGTAISSLSGAAATNAALAWLGGGAVVAGGGGMAAGEAFLALAGPIGWAIAGVALIASGLLFWKSLKDKKHLEDVFSLISERDVKSYNLAIVELNERIQRIQNESHLLNNAIDSIRTFGKDYLKMTEAQQYELGAYVNLMNASTQLLVNPIMGLQAKYTEEDFKNYIDCPDNEVNVELCKKFESLIISLSNLLFKIDLNDRDKKLFWKSVKSNKKMRKALNLSKRELKRDILDIVFDALRYNYEIKGI